LALRTIYSSTAERSAALLNRALALYRDQQAATAPSPQPRIPPLLGNLGVDRQTLIAHDAIFRLVAVAEDFSLLRLIEITEDLLPAGRLVEVLWEGELDRSMDTWDSRLGAWSRLHQIEVKSQLPRYDRLDGFIQARNAIAHGLGQLTRKQSGNRAATVQRLAAAGIKTNGDVLILGLENVETCAAVCESFVLWLDEQAAAL
jgi:hypothetical protein